MTRRFVSRVFAVACFVGAAFLLPAIVVAQDSSSKPVRATYPDIADISAIENMYVPPKAHVPFAGKSVVTLTQTRGGATERAEFFSMVARDSAGRIYFENRRPLPASGQASPRSQFILIDPAERTRTVCYVATKTCRINNLRRVTYANSDPTEVGAPAATRTSVAIGTEFIDALRVEGTRETLEIAAGAYGNSRPLAVTREAWHSPDLDVDISIIRTGSDGSVQTRKIEDLSRAEPDPANFTIPSDYKILDNREPAKNNPAASHP